MSIFCTNSTNKLLAQPSKMFVRDTQLWEILLVAEFLLHQVALTLIASIDKTLRLKNNDPSYDKIYAVFTS